MLRFKLITIILLVSLIILGLLNSCDQKENVDFIYDAYKKNECESAISLDQTVVRSNINNPKFWYFKGLCNLKLQNFQNAKLDFLRADELDYKYKAFVLFGLSVVEFNIGNNEKAIDYLESSVNNGLPYSLFEHPFLEKYKNLNEYVELKEQSKPSFNFWTSILFFLAIQGGLLGFYILLKNTSRREKNIYLALLLVLYCVLLISYSLKLSRLNYYFPYLNDSFHIILLCIGPLLYFYFKSVFIYSKLSLEYFKHLVPAFFMAIAIYLYYINSINYSLYTIIINSYFKIIHMLFYGILTFIIYKKHKSHHDKHIKSWFYLILLSYGSFVISVVIQNIVFDFFIYTVFADMLVLVSICSLLILVALMGYVQPQIFLGESLKRAVTQIKYGRSGISVELSKELKDKLLNKMNTDMLFLKSDLTLDQLADEMNISRHHLSQVINENFDMGYYDFVNKFRIEYAKEILVKDSKTPIIDIVYKVGFNNKVSFNKSFKKLTSITPSQYSKNKLKSKR